MLALFAIAINTIIKYYILRAKKNKNNNLKDDHLSIDDIIEELEFKLQRAEIQAEKGDEEAINKIPLIKNELKKLREWK
jgi:uncharacterized protein involved in exopolysaccharide biosynthesis